MALVVETGAIVPSANSFIELADVLAFLTDRNIHTAWAATSAQVQTAAVLFAGDYLKNEERFKYVGSRISRLQTMPWPRRDAKEYRGPDIPEDEIPWRVKEAQIVLAYRSLGADLQPDLVRGGLIKTETVDVITTTYQDSAPAEDTITAVMGILRPLLVKGIGTPAPYQAVPANLSPFETDEFNAP